MTYIYINHISKQIFWSESSENLDFTEMGFPDGLTACMVLSKNAALLYIHLY